MGFSEIINPFKRDTEDFSDVIIPLADAPAHTEISEKTDKQSDSNSDGASSSENGAGSPKHSTHLTLEALRAEVEADVTTATHDTAYDRMFSYQRGSPENFQILRI